MGDRSRRLAVVSLARVLLPALLALVIPCRGLAFELVGLTEQVAAPGETISWSVTMSDIANDPPGPVEALYLLLSYDASVLAITASRAGSFFNPGTTSFVPNSSVAGQYSVSIVPVLGQPLVEGGQVLEIDFEILPAAVAGPVNIDLTSSEVNEGYLSAVLVDGVITVQLAQQDELYDSNVMTIIRACQVVGC